MSTELIVQDTNPGALMTRATDVAGVCKEIVKRTARNIQGRKYVQVEGWQSIAAAYGCVASSVEVQRVEGGVRAVGELRRVSDGQLLAKAEGFVGEDEATWFGGESRGKTLPKRNDFAIRAMAQTRAISRVCRSAFAFVVVLIDSNLSTTPAEEMHGVFPDEDVTQAIPATRSQHVEPEAPPRTRDAVLTELCTATTTNKIDLLSKAEVTHADEMSDDDWASALRFLKKKQASMAEKVQA